MSRVGLQKNRFPVDTALRSSKRITRKEELGKLPLSAMAPGRLILMVGREWKVNEETV